MPLSGDVCVPESVTPLGVERHDLLLHACPLAQEDAHTNYAMLNSWSRVQAKH